MNTKPAGATGCVVLAVTPFAACGFLGLVFAVILGDQAPANAAAIAVLERCPAVIEALGSPLEIATLPPGCGAKESSAGYGHTSWSMTVSGPRGSARASYAAKFEAGGPWRVDGAWIELGGRRVDALTCARGAH